MYTPGDMRAIKQLGILTVLSLATNACNSKSTLVHPRDGATDPDVGSGVGGNGKGGAGGGTGGNGGVAEDSELTDGSRDALADALAVGPTLDGSGSVADDAVTNDGLVVVDLQPIEARFGEGGAAACGEVGAACTDQTSCSSGDDVDIGCRSLLVCQNGILTTPFLYIRCGATSGSACPTTQPTQGTACTLSAQTCSFSTGTCTCTAGCGGGTDAGPCPNPTTWHCDAPLRPGCPTQAPQLGAPCSDGKVSCSYGGYCAQYAVSCQGGYWEPYVNLPFGGCQ